MEPSLHDLVALSADDVYDRLGGPAMNVWDARAMVDPADVGRRLGELLRAGGTANGVLTWLGLLPSPVPVATAMVVAHPGLRAAIIGLHLSDSPDDLLLIAPPDVLVPAFLAGEPWTEDVMPVFLDAAWERLDPQRWARLDALLAVGEDAPFAETATEMLGRADWARHDPWPLRFAGSAVPREALADAYPDLFGDDEPRVRRARLEVDEVERTFAGRADQGWLRSLGRVLPGCDVRWCCRPGLFEAELVARGHRPR